MLLMHGACSRAFFCDAYTILCHRISFLLYVWKLFAVI